MVRRAAVGLITFVIVAPVSSMLFLMGLVVVEWVIHPTAVMVTAMLSALAASWIADWLVEDGQTTDLNRVITKNLMWGLVPALGALAYSRLLQLPLAPLVGATVIWTVAFATRFALKLRQTPKGKRRRLGNSLAWLVGTGVATATIIFVAGLFGLTGA